MKNWQLKTAQQLDCLAVEQQDRYVEGKVSILKDGVFMDVDEVPFEKLLDKKYFEDKRYIHLDISGKDLSESFLNFIRNHGKDQVAQKPFDFYTDEYRFVNCRLSSFNLGRKKLKISWIDVTCRQL